MENNNSFLASLCGKSDAESLFVRFDSEKSHRRQRRIGSPCFLRKFALIIMGSVIGLSATGAFIEDNAAGVVVNFDGGARELLPKVWVPDPRGATRETSEMGSWYDPSKENMFPSSIFQMFKTVAAWKLPERIYSKSLALRALNDDKAYLIDDREFCERVARILKSGGTSTEAPFSIR